ncbi:hypothetical protein BJX99DRAFT_23755 [Aspergillus californicus]
MLNGFVLSMLAESTLTSSQSQDKSAVFPLFFPKTFLLRQYSTLSFSFLSATAPPSLTIAAIHTYPQDQHKKIQNHQIAHPQHSPLKNQASPPHSPCKDPPTYNSHPRPPLRNLKTNPRLDRIRPSQHEQHHRPHD